MDYKKLENLKYPELKSIAIEIGIPVRRSKTELYTDIKKSFKEYETYKTCKLDKYKKLCRLGERSKETITYLVVTNQDQEYAMKSYRKNKSSVNLKKEAEFQKTCYDVGISPKLIDIDTVSKYIVMDKLETHLDKQIENQNYVLTREQQRQIINIYKKLDLIKIYHGDVNLKNFMLDKKGKIFIIDFGDSKEITKNFCIKLGTLTPNVHIMTLGLALNLKKIGCSESSYDYLLKYIPEEQLIHFKITKSKKIV
jgi:predicted Ser/Thr protein kinase